MIRKIVAVVLAGTLAASFALAGPEGSVRGGDRDRAPVISVNDFNLDNYLGSVVLIGFWQTTKCPPCESYITWLTEMQARYLEDGLVIVAVNQDRDASAATDLLNKIHQRTQVILDPTGKMGTRYQLEGMPSTYLYNRNLNMKDKFVGFDLEETTPLEAAIVKLLEQEYQE